jgi:hypothetical protein
MDGKTSLENGGTPPEPRHLRNLRWLVSVLTVTLILGVITIVVLLVIRLNAFTASSGPGLPATVEIPAGETTRAVTLGTGWIAVVTVDEAGQERIRVLDATTGEPRGMVEVTQP